MPFILIGATQDTGINDYPINLLDDKQSLYDLPSHPLALWTLSIRKMDGNLWPCIWGLNNPIIKNR